MGLFDRFEDWVNEQPANRKFDNLSTTECALAKYAREVLGWKSPSVGGFDMFDVQGDQSRVQIPEKLALAIITSRTFGEVAQKLSKVA